jgi:hypothetical protein
MSYTAFYKLNLAILIGVICAIPQALSAGSILYQEEAVEADRIEVLVSKGSQTGQVRVSGCTGCPMTLTVDGATEFYYKHKPADQNRVIFLSGKTGTVIFDKDQQRALRIYW